MKSTFIWLLLAIATLLLGDAVDAWNRQIFNRYSRNLLRNGDMSGAAAAAGSNQIDEFNALFGINNDAGIRGGGGAGLAGGGGNAVLGMGGMTATDVDTGGYVGQQQEREVYGIVEPLIEDTPCVDRPCEVNDDCCPTGVCVNTYGEGKCVYVYGRKRDHCHRNTDCEPGMACLRGAAGNLICQPTTTTAMHMLNVGGVGIGAGAGAGGGIGGGGAGVSVGVGSAGAIAVKSLEVKQFGEDCVSSSECNVAKGMCCQLQRSHHRMLPRKLCAYFRDPFTCIDIMPTENEEMRESRFLSSFSQRRM